MDCKSGYWQIKMEEESIPLTAFSAPQGHYDWIVMPFGRNNAPQIFKEEWITSLKNLIIVVWFISMTFLSFLRLLNSINLTH